MTAITKCDRAAQTDAGPSHLAQLDGFSLLLELVRAQAEIFQAFEAVLNPVFSGLTPKEMVQLAQRLDEQSQTIRSIVLRKLQDIHGASKT